MVDGTLEPWIISWFMGAVVAGVITHIDWFVKMRLRTETQDYIRHPLFEPVWGEWQDYLWTWLSLVFLGWISVGLFLIAAMSGWIHINTGRDAAIWYIEPLTPGRWWQIWRIGTD